MAVQIYRELPRVRVPVNRGISKFIIIQEALDFTFFICIQI